MIKKIACLITFFLFSTTPIAAKQVLGVHVLHPGEIAESATLIRTDEPAISWSYVTLPLSLDDLAKHDQWQQAFSEAKKHKLIPIVRLATRFNPEKNAWEIPTREHVMQLFTFLSQLTWPHEKKYVIVFNEPNHISEWGGTIDPTAYAKILRFSANWAHTEPGGGYQVLPAGLDLAAPNGATTIEAFNYLNQMLTADPEIFTVIDYWNSHSYPNPAFSSPPTKTGQNSLQGFTYELAWLKTKTNLAPKVFITETGWEENATTRTRLNQYYQYAYDYIWSHESVVAVTPFILKGDPGPFAKFSFLDRDNRTTRQYDAYRIQVEKNLAAQREEIKQLLISYF